MDELGTAIPFDFRMGKIKRETEVFTGSKFAGS